MRFFRTCASTLRPGAGNKRSSRARSASEVRSKFWSCAGACLPGIQCIASLFVRNPLTDSQLHADRALHEMQVSVQSARDNVNRNLWSFLYQTLVFLAPHSKENRFAMSSLWIGNSSSIHESSSLPWNKGFLHLGESVDGERANFIGLVLCEAKRFPYILQK